MRSTAAIVVIGLLALAILFVGFRGSDAPAVAVDHSSAQRLGAGRVVMLLPDGRVEVSDAWARRLFRWDGRRWVESQHQERTATGERSR